MTKGGRCHRVATLCIRMCTFVPLFIFFLFPYQAHAQFPDECTLNCTASDIEQIIAFLGDTDTIPLDIDCEVGSPVDDVVIWIEITLVLPPASVRRPPVFLPVMKFSFRTSLRLGPNREVARRVRIVQIARSAHFSRIFLFRHR